MKKTLNVALPGMLIAALLLGRRAEGATNPVLHWNDVAIRLSVEARVDPIRESRLLAMVQIAVHDALNAIESRYETYRPGLAPAPGASADAAVAQASHDVLAALLPAESRAALDRELNQVLASLADGTAKVRGIESGRSAAARILSERRQDGSERTTDYKPGTKPGQYRPTPPDLTPAFLTQWGGVRPFALRSSEQFRPAPPPEVGGEIARFDLDEVAEIGSEASTARTPEQSEIARFWYEDSPLGWNRIAQVVAAERKLDAWESARLLALVHIAMADGFIAGFEAKYHYNYWRPVTALRESGHPEWSSFLWTPPVPDYPSTHTVLGAAAATVLARFCGSDCVAFASTSGAPYPGITRSFWSFSQAARENGASRVFAGIHFSTAVRAGYDQGEAIGAWAFNHLLRPVRTAAAVASGGPAR